MNRAEIEAYIREIQATKIEEFKDRAAEAELFRIKYLGKKGVIGSLFEQFKSIPPEQKKEVGQVLNQLKEIGRASCRERV